jgi:hypothetical protein
VSTVTGILAGASGVGIGDGGSVRGSYRRSRAGVQRAALRSAPRS